MRLERVSQGGEGVSHSFRSVWSILSSCLELRRPDCESLVRGEGGFGPLLLLAQQLPDHTLHSVGPDLVPALTWVQVIWHEVSTEASQVVEKVPAEV